MSEPVPFDSWAMGEIVRLQDLVMLLLDAAGIEYEFPERPAVESIESVVSRRLAGTTKTVKEIERDDNGEISRIIEYRPPLDDPI